MTSATGNTIISTDVSTKTITEIGTDTSAIGSTQTTTINQFSTITSTQVSTTTIISYQETSNSETEQSKQDDSPLILSWFVFGLTLILFVRRKIRNL